MPAYIRLSLRGTIVGGEVWSVNPVIDPAGELPWDTFDQASFDAFTAAVGAITLPQILRNCMAPTTVLTSVRAELRHTEQVGFLGASEHTLPTPVAGAGTAYKPPQVAVVASLRSGSALASGRGRIYWPATGVPMESSTLRLSNTTATSIANGFVTYLGAICAAAKAQLAPVSLVNFFPAIYSPTKRTLTAVSSIRVGDVLDTQRRRRDALPETYQTVTYPTV